MPRFHGLFKAQKEAEAPLLEPATWSVCLSISSRTSLKFVNFLSPTLSKTAQASFSEYSSRDLLTSYFTEICSIGYIMLQVLTGYCANWLIHRIGLVTNMLIHLYNYSLRSSFRYDAFG